MKLLKIRLTPTLHPYPDEPETFLEAWGEILTVVQEEAATNELNGIQWDALCLLEWFAQNRTSIAFETFSVLGERPYPDESLSEALIRIRLERFLEASEPKELVDRWSKEYEGFFERHSLARGLPGSRMPNIVMGLNRGAGEISLVDQNNKWKYDFDMRTFWLDFRDEAQRFVLGSLGNNQNRARKERVAKNLRSMEQW